MSVMVRDSFPKTLGATVGKKLSKSKAREILSHGEVRGHKLSKKQRGFFGAVSQGKSFKNRGRSPLSVGIASHIDYVR